MNITAIIILYNSNIENSGTIQSLLTANIKDINLKIIIWNNGPQRLTAQECQKIKNIFNLKKIELSIYEDINNIALSKIYNLFLKSEHYDFFSLLDQDSQLNEDFFQNIVNNNNYDVIVPSIYSAGWRTKENSLCFPVYHKNHEILDKKTFLMGEIESIASGLTLSHRLITSLVNIKKEIFNERYALYGIDTDFFINLKSLNDKIYKGICVGKINHSLDFNLQDRKKISPSRKLEMEYSKVLNKLFHDKKNRLNVFFYLLRKFFKKEYSSSTFLKLLKCLIRKQHPRACISIKLKQLL